MADLEAKNTKPFEWPNFQIKRARNGWLLVEDPGDYHERDILTVAGDIDPLLDAIRARVLTLATEHPEA